MTGERGGVVLAGGRSRRMGTDKADLPWAGTTLLGTVLAVLGNALDGPLVVVGPADRPRPLPALPAGLADRVRVVADPVAARGPLQGLATGLTAAAHDGARHAFVASVDLPHLHVPYVLAVLAVLDGLDGLGGLGGPDDDVEVALPVVHGHRQPLAAAYATDLGARATELIERGAQRPGELFAVSRVVELDETRLLADPALAATDPGLRAVVDVDTPEELRALRDTSPEDPTGTDSG